MRSLGIRPSLMNTVSDAGAAQIYRIPDTPFAYRMEGQRPWPSGCLVQIVDLTLWVSDSSGGSEGRGRSDSRSGCLIQRQVYCKTWFLLGMFCWGRDLIGRPHV